MANYNLFITFLLFSLVFASTVIAKSHRPISDMEIKERKSLHAQSVKDGLWGWQCKSSQIAKENCGLKCLSPTCYDLVYGSDPLEEGEKDFIRGQEFKWCMHKLSIGESIEGVKGSFNH